MKATLLERKGKYYGTEIQIKFDSEYTTVIKLWHNGDYTPSRRELERRGFTEQQWNNNELVDAGWDEDGVMYPIKEVVDICDSHFESKYTYEKALELIRKINS